MTVLDPGGRTSSRVASLAVGKAGATATATAYVTPSAVDGTPAVYLVRVAQVTLQSPSGGLPTLTVRFAGRDVTPPHILVSSPGTAEPNKPVLYNALDSSDAGSGIDPTTAHWEFYDKSDDQPHRRATAS